jgi:uncharacterized protein YegL
MAGAKIQALNAAIREAIPAMRDTADDNPNAQVLVRAISFSDNAQWYVATPTPIEQFQWQDMSADGVTDLGSAFSELAKELSVAKMGDRALPPVIVLLTDGQPTDDWRKGLKELTDQPWGKKAVRIGIAIGEDAELSVIQEFIGNPELKPLLASNSATLVRYIKWASTAVLKAASSPASKTKEEAAASGANVAIPQAPPPVPSDAGPGSAGDVW